MLGYCAEHEVLILLSALRLHDLVLGPRVVSPDVAALAPVNLASKRQ